MKKYTYTIIIVIIVLIAITGFMYKNTSSDWSRYTSTILGVSIEYPTKSMTPTSEGSFGTTTVRIDNDSGNKIQIPIGDLKMILFTIVPTNPTEIKSVDDWIALAKSKNNFSDPFPNLRYDSVDGERVAISDYNDGSSAYANTTVLFFRNNRLYQLTINNFSPADTERIWKSLLF